MLDYGLTWDLAKEQCGGDGTEKEFVVPPDDPALLWAGLHDIAKRLRHEVAQRLSPDDTRGFANSYAAWFFAAVEAGLAFGESGEFRARDYLRFYTSRDGTISTEAKLSDNFQSKLSGKVWRLSFDAGYTEDEIIYNALQVGLREDIYPRLRAYVGSTGAALATETPIDSDFGELTMPKIAEAVPKGRLGDSHISGCGLSRMAFDFGERIGLERMSDDAGRKLRLTFVRTGPD